MIHDRNRSCRNREPGAPRGRRFLPLLLLLTTTLCLRAGEPRPDPLQPPPPTTSVPPESGTPAFPLDWDAPLPEFDDFIPGIPRASLLDPDPSPPHPPAPADAKDPPPPSSPDTDPASPPPAPPSGEETSTLRFRLRRGGHPAAGRLTILSQDGELLDPLPGFPFRWIRSDDEITVPPGGYTLRIEAGLRTSPWMGLASIRPGDTIEVEAELEAYSSTSQIGWHAVDPFLYAYTRPPTPGRYAYPDPDAIRLAGAADDIRVLGVSHAWNLPGPEGIPFARMEDGTGALARALEGPPGEACTLFSAWTLSHPEAGRFYVLEPTPSPPAQRFVDGGDYAPLFARIHDRRSVIVISHPTGVIEDPAQGTTAEVAGDFLFHTLAGPLYDAIDIRRRGADLDLWQMLLQQGYRIPAVGGGPGIRLPTGVDLPEPAMVVELPRRDVTFPHLRDAIRAGRSVVGTGPFIRIYVDGIGSGGSVPVVNRPRHVFVDAYATSDPEDSIAGFEIVYNGRVIHTWEGGHKQKTVSGHTRPLRLDEPGWILARYRSTAADHWAITNPVYIGEDRQPRPLLAVATVRVFGSGGEPLDATVEVFQFGTRILRRESAGGEGVVLRVPATARVRVSAPGHAAREVDLYRDTEAGAMIESLRESGYLRGRMLGWQAYADLAERMGDLRVDVRLESAPVP